jgi:hypothetical protein
MVGLEQDRHRRRRGRRPREAVTSARLVVGACALLLAWSSACSSGGGGSSSDAAAGQGGALGLGASGSFEPAGGSKDDVVAGQGSAQAGAVQGLGGREPTAGSWSMGGVATGGNVDTGGAANGAAAGDGVGSGAAAGNGSETPCCEPKTCEDLPANVECGYVGYDECLGQDVDCQCPVGAQCSDGQCVVCDAGSDPCQLDLNLCGSTTDACGNPIVCPDLCEEVTAGLGGCYGGSCCYFDKYFCDFDDCGMIDIGCGATIECGNPCEGDATCQPNHKCCAPTNACSPGACGQVDDGCGNLLDCGNICGADQACVEEECRPSGCLANGFECGFVENMGGFEYCGACEGGHACMEHLCVPVCAP